MFARLLSAAVLVVTLPAAAKTFDNSANFTTVQGIGGFTYGSFDETTSAFTAFDSSSNCVIGNVICLRSTTANLPSAFKSDGTAATSGSVILTAGTVIVHPGATDQSVYVAWTAPGAYHYDYSALFTKQDTGNGNTPHSVGITEFLIPVAGPTQFFDRLVLDGSTTDILTGYFIDAAAGDTIGYIIDKDGNFSNDSTGVSFTVTGDIPEPASWAMMVAGFGMIGLIARRRARIAAA